MVRRKMSKGGKLRKMSKGGKLKMLSKKKDKIRRR